MVRNRVDNDSCLLTIELIFLNWKGGVEGWGWGVGRDGGLFAILLFVYQFVSFCLVLFLHSLFAAFKSSVIHSENTRH